MPNQKVISAGGVIYKNNERNEIEIYLCKHNKLGLVLPKGKSENGETIRETAEREVEEETGFKLTSGAELGMLSYSFELDGNMVDKEVNFFAFEFTGQSQNQQVFKNETNITPGQWFKASEALSVITHKTEADMCLKVIQSM